ncbi:MAG: DNA cytosine methyltransferase [Saprospiraceae bacterium]
MFDLFNQQPTFTKQYNRLELPKRPLTFGEVNANIGGMRSALEALDLESVWAYEKERFAQLTYTANFNQKPNANISKPKTLQSTNIITASLQPTLADFQAFANILKHQQNVAFIIETKKSLFLNKSKLWQKVMQTLTECNFDVFYAILDAVKFGVPQYRKQLYFVGFRCDYFESKPTFNFPKGLSKKVYIKDILEENVDGYAVSEHFQEFHLFRNETAQVVSNQSKIMVKPLVPSYHKVQPLVGTFVQDGETGIRLLSENECKALMGFDRDFMFPVSRTQMYRQLGKSVVVPVIQSIGKEVLNTIVENS